MSVKEAGLEISYRQAKLGCVSLEQSSAMCNHHISDLYPAQLGPLVRRWRDCDSVVPGQQSRIHNAKRLNIHLD